MSAPDEHHRETVTAGEGSPEDTRPLPGEASALSRSGSSPGGSRAGTAFDTIVSRYVVEMGLATQEEVDHCRALAQQSDASAQSLTDLLVQHEYVTERQMSRLRSRVEDERKGQKIPGFKITGKLGAGAMATVYKARQISLDRDVAIKILPRKYSADAGFIKRFYAEGKAAAQLNHPNIVQAFDVGNADEIYYFVMEYVDGGTVHDVIAKNKRYDEKDAVETAIQVAEALQHAHERGLVHRDVKPKNLMISRQGVVKLADMGLARGMSDKEAADAEKGKAFGTPYYISPEQIQGERDIGPQADIYSLGATLYHMVTGSVPYEGSSPQAVMSKHLRAQLVPPDHVNPRLSAGISEVIEMMMAKKRSDRYRDCADLLMDLHAVRKGQKPPIAHKDIVPADELADLAKVEASVSEDEIAVDRSRPRGGFGDLVREPVFIAVALLLALSIAGNVAQIASSL